jgi:uncharacterized protein YdhG (YjbR/CyaY superfamily)
MTKHYKSVDKYISAFPAEIAATLESIRETIHEAAPGAEEGIRYQMPAFKLDGKTLAYLAAFKKHIGFYPPPPEAFKKEAARYAGPKGSLKFPLDKPVPLDLVRRIVRARVKGGKTKQ